MSKDKPAVKTSTKSCPKCNNNMLLQMRSQNKKVCTDCGTELNWYLDEGQKPLL